MDSDVSRHQTIFNEAMTASISKDIINGLFQIHKKNYIHRDLKPENILVHVDDDAPQDDYQARFTAKIADFGLSAEIHASIFNK